MDYSIKIGGEAGQGIQTIGDTLTRVFSKTGYHVFTYQDYESRIRGGHNFFQIRVSDMPVTAPADTIDILVALDHASIELHEKELSEYGRVIYDPASLKQKYGKASFLDIPFEQLALEHGGNRIMANTVATGAVLGMLGMDMEILHDIIKDTFRSKGDNTIDANVSASMAGYDFAARNCDKCSFAVSAKAEPKMLISGVEAIAFGAIASGCKFYSAYPMTPSTGIMNYIAGKGDSCGIVVEQAEDEIAAINMALGASFAGVRSMTSSSGGGFALMVEGVSLAAMTETPVVIGLGQRPGPATGFPTRTEQGDLQFALYSAHGEFPRIIFAPGTPEQAFYLTNKAFDLSEKYQVTAFILFDTYIADTQWTYSSFDIEKLKNIDYRLRSDALNKLPGYKRYALTADGVSPMALPGDSAHLVVADSDEHSEEGHIVEDAETRIAMVQKRLFKKMRLISDEIQPPLFYGDEKPEIILTGWGSTYGVMKEAVDILSENYKAGMLHFSEIYPFPSGETLDYLGLLTKSRLSICIENNATGQFARLMKTETGYEFNAHINKYDGRPFTVKNLMDELNGYTGRL